MFQAYRPYDARRRDPAISQLAALLQSIRGILR